MLALAVERDATQELCDSLKRIQHGVACDVRFAADYPTAKLHSTEVIPQIRDSAAAR